MDLSLSITNFPDLPEYIGKDTPLYPTSLYNKISVQDLYQLEPFSNINISPYKIILALIVIFAILTIFLLIEY